MDQVYLPNNKRVRQAMAGAGAGALTKTSVAPLERVKILFQIQGMQGNTGDNRKYRGLLQSLRLIVKEEGTVSLWKGNGANCVRVVPVYALKFAFNDTFKDMVKAPEQTERDLTISQRMLAGTLAGLCQTSLTYPLETVRTRLSIGSALSGVHYNGILDCFRTTIKQEGGGALYKGIMPTYISGAPYVGLQMTFFDVYKNWLVKDNIDVSESNGRSSIGSAASKVGSMMMAGALAGMTAQTITYPGDTIRRRMQSNGMGGTKILYKNSWHCTTTIIKTEGIVGLYRGLLINCIRGIPGAAIQFAAYESLKTLFDCK
jgi:hypothetical protein